MRTLFRSTLAMTVLTFAALAARAQDPKVVIEKAMKAQGGEDNLKKYPAARVKAKGSGQPADEPCAGFGAAGSHEYAGDFAKGASRLR